MFTTSASSSVGSGLRNTVAHIANRQWIKLASEVARKVGWLLWYR
jgi:hypothetical protein